MTCDAVVDECNQAFGDLRLGQLRTPVQPPAGVGAQPQSEARSLLAVVQASQEKRLVLVGQPSDLKQAFGVVLRTATLGLPAAALDSLKQRFPDLNTDYVLCTGWDWPDSASPYDAQLYSIAWCFGVVLGPLALLCVAAYLYWRRRRRALAERWLAFLRGTRTTATPG